jgi:two-component system, NtrC family, response regulator HydG
MVPTLITSAGPAKGAAFSLDRAETSIGRDQTNCVVLADRSVSPRHCVLLCNEGGVTIRDVDPANPSFVNGLPASEQMLAHGDRIRIGTSTFVLTVEPVAAADRVHVEDESAGQRSLMVMRREDALIGRPSADGVSPERLERDLAGLMRVSAAISSVRGLAALERPLIELIAEVVPADRGAVILSGDSRTEIASALGCDRQAGGARTLHVSRPVIDRVLHEAVGVMTTGPLAASSVLAAPLVAFDKLLGAIYLESDSPDQPFDEGRLRLLMSIASVTATALGHEQHAEALADETRRLQAELDVNHHMIGDSPVMRLLYRQIGRVAPRDSTVLITGESGTGKELVARALRSNSRRADRPFVAINCAAITETLLESELFGHEKGAFTGAIARKKGKLETADGGTVLLDEVGELSPALQAKLLRVLQEREFERVGGTRSIAVDFRLLAATNCDLEQAIAAGTFRRDLYYRLNVVSLAVPPLRDRPEDIPVLANHFARRHAANMKRRLTGVSADALAYLTAYDWPGNVRELENAIERAVALGSTDLIVPDDLPEALIEAGPTAPSTGAASGLGDSHFHDAIRQAKKDLIVKAFASARGSYSGAARLLGLHPNYLHRLIRNLNLKTLLKKASESGNVRPTR